MRPLLARRSLLVTHFQSPVPVANVAGMVLQLCWRDDVLTVLRGFYITWCLAVLIAIYGRIF